MRCYHIHPLKPQGGTTVPDLQLVAAIVHQNETGGAMQVLIPTFKTRLEELFESPQIGDGGQKLEPWSDQALDYLLDVGLARSGFAAIEVSG